MSTMRKKSIYINLLNIYKKQYTVIDVYTFCYADHVWKEYCKYSS